MTNRLINSYDFKHHKNNQTTCVASFTIINSKQCEEMKSNEESKAVESFKTNNIELSQNEIELPNTKHNSHRASFAEDTPEAQSDVEMNENHNIYGINGELIRENNNLPDKRRNSRSHPEKKCGITSNIF
jgi:hypothetical protein